MKRSEKCEGSSLSLIKDLEIKNKEAKIDTLLSVCFRYAESIYRFVGNFRQDNLDEHQKADLVNLKEAVDSCIESNNNYKYYIDHKYIKKDFNYNNPGVVKFIESLREHEFEGFKISDKVVEDDTETLIIKDEE